MPPLLSRYSRAGRKSPAASILVFRFKHRPREANGARKIADLENTAAVSINGAFDRKRIRRGPLAASVGLMSLAARHEMLPAPIGAGVRPSIGVRFRGAADIGRRSGRARNRSL